MDSAGNTSSFEFNKYNFSSQQINFYKIQIFFMLWKVHVWVSTSNIAAHGSHFIGAQIPLLCAYTIATFKPRQIKSDPREASHASVRCWGLLFAQGQSGTNPLPLGQRASASFFPALPESRGNFPEGWGESSGKVGEMASLAQVLCNLLALVWQGIAMAKLSVPHSQCGR